MRKRKTDNVFVWEDGSNSALTWNKWLPGGQGDGGDCVAMERENGFWDTTDCERADMSQVCSVNEGRYIEIIHCFL